MRKHSLLILTFSLFLLLLRQASSKEDFNVTHEAFLITQNRCHLIKDDAKAPPIMLKAADLVVIGKSGSVKKTYGDGNTKYEISMTPHCILKGNTDLKEVTVRNMGQGDCGATDVEKNDMKPYLFFLRATSNPKVFEALNLGVKRITDPNMIFGPAFTYFCSLKNKKLCTGAACVQACNFTPMPSSGCIPFEQNVIYEIKAERRKRTIVAPEVTAAPKVGEFQTTEKPKMEVSTVKAAADEESKSQSFAEIKVQKKIKRSGSSAFVSIILNIIVAA